MVESPRITQRTYHKIHGTRPRAGGSVGLDIDICLSFVDHGRISNKFSGISRCTPHVIETENDLKDLSDGLLCISDPGTPVEPGAIEVISRPGASRVDHCGVGEVGGL